MNAKELINGIIDLDNENKALKTKLNISNSLTLTVIDEIQKDIFLKGLEATINSYCDPFDYPEEIFNSFTGEYIPFEVWVQGVSIDKFDRRLFPDKVQENLSNKQIIELYEPYLRRKYNEFTQTKQYKLTNESSKC